MEEVRLGNIYGATGGNYAGWVYGKDGLCPTINTAGGGNRQPMVIDEENLEQYIVAQRGRDKFNPNHRGPANENYEQRLEVREDECSNTLTTVQKDNLVLEVNPEDDGTSRTIKAQYYKNGLANLIRRDSFGCTGAVELVPQDDPNPKLLQNWIWCIKGIYYLIRVRKLTPRECWRLMGFTDQDFSNAEEVNSNTQLYKQAGNSIVVQVLMSVFAQFYPNITREKLEKKIDNHYGNWFRDEALDKQK